MLRYQSYQDEALVDLLKEHDQAAFAELYDRYHQRIYGYALTLVKMPHLAEDIVHEVFLKIWEVRERLQLQHSFDAYLFRVCHNKAVDMLRKVSADREMLKELLDQYVHQTGSIGRPTGELQRIDNLIEEALQSLPPRRRMVYQLCKQQGNTYREAGLKLGISPHTVKEHLVNALDGLRHFLNKKNNYPPTSPASKK